MAFNCRCCGYSLVSDDYAFCQYCLLAGCEEDNRAVNNYQFTKKCEDKLDIKNRLKKEKCRRCGELIQYIWEMWISDEDRFTLCPECGETLDEKIEEGLTNLGLELHHISELGDEERLELLEEVMLAPE